MKGMFSGRQIKDLKGRGQKITRSQTASNALNAITDKYGGIVDNAHYFHVGKGVWKKYSLESDKTRTGKIAPSKAAWAERPNKFDWDGIDTKESKKVVTNKKPRFSVTSLAKGKMTGRKGKQREDVVNIIDDWRKDKKIIVKDRKQSPIKKTVYGIQRNVGNGWEPAQLIIDDKEDAYTRVNKQNRENKNLGMKLRVVPTTSIKGKGVPHNTYAPLPPNAGRLTERRKGDGMKLTGRAVTKVVLKPLPSIEIIHHYTKGKRNGSYAPTRIVKDPLQAFKIYYQKNNRDEIGLLFASGSSLVSATQITMEARVDTPSVLYNTMIKKLFLDDYYAYLKYNDDPLKMKKAPLRTVSVRENWQQGAVM